MSKHGIVEELSLILLLFAMGSILIRGGTGAVLRLDWYPEGMPEFQSIDDMMQSYADDAVRTAHDRFGFSLDYSPESIESVETILAGIGADLDLSAKDNVEEQVKLWGGYLGEVIRRRWNGTWDLIQYPGRAEAMPALMVSGSQIFPLMKVYRRLTVGESENVWKFYEQIRSRISSVAPVEESRTSSEDQ